MPKIKKSYPSYCNFLPSFRPNEVIRVRRATRVPPMRNHPCLRAFSMSNFVQSCSQNKLLSSIDAFVTNGIAPKFYCDLNTL